MLNFILLSFDGAIRVWARGPLFMHHRFFRKFVLWLYYYMVYLKTQEGFWMGTNPDALKSVSDPSARPGQKSFGFKKEPKLE